MVPIASESIIGFEKLETWRHSDGTAVGYGEIQVEARRVGPKAVAIVQPLPLARSQVITRGAV